MGVGLKVGLLDNERIGEVACRPVRAATGAQGGNVETIDTDGAVRICLFNNFGMCDRRDRIAHP